MSNYYFGEKEEQAVVDYLKSTNQIEKNKIYNKYLLEPIRTMVESIIKTYKHQSRFVSIEEQIDDTIGFLHEKMHKFNPDLGKKAYSYYSTIVRNKLRQQQKTEYKQLKRELPYCSYQQMLIEDENHSYRIDNDENFNEFIFVGFKEMLDEIIEINDITSFFTIDEERVVLCVYDLVINHDFILKDFEINNKKSHNSIILEYLRNSTQMSTKDIRKHLKKLKSLYYKYKCEEVNKDLV